MMARLLQRPRSVSMTACFLGSLGKTAAAMPVGQWVRYSLGRVALALLGTIFSRRYRVVKLQQLAGMQVWQDSLPNKRRSNLPRSQRAADLVCHSARAAERICLLVARASLGSFVGP